MVTRQEEAVATLVGQRQGMLHRIRLAKSERNALVRNQGATEKEKRGFWCLNFVIDCPLSVAPNHMHTSNTELLLNE